MKRNFVRFFMIALAVLIAQNSFSQDYGYDNGYKKTTSIQLSADVVFPYGALASSNYKLAGGADQYSQEGTFAPSVGGTVAVEVLISNNISLRPKLSLVSLKGNHYVGGFDNPKMMLSETRLAGDLLLYVGQTRNIYLFVSGGMNMEKLTVDRLLFKEKFTSQRPTLGGGLGYVFGYDKGMFVEMEYLQSMGGTPPCNEDFPDLTLAKISLGIKF